MKLILKKELDTYLQQYFVSVCTEYLQLLNHVGQVPIKLVKMGTWVGKEGSIDIIGQNAQRENVVGICNGQRMNFPMEDTKKLLVQMKKAKISANVIYLFSAKKFDAEIENWQQNMQRSCW